MENYDEQTREKARKELEQTPYFRVRKRIKALFIEYGFEREYSRIFADYPIQTPRTDSQAGLLTKGAIMHSLIKLTLMFEPVLDSEKNKRINELKLRIGASS